MNRAALFFDIDGTVLSEITKEIPASTVDALKRAHDAGHFLFINTGRTYCSHSRHSGCDSHRSPLKW